MRYGFQFFVQAITLITSSSYWQFLRTGIDSSGATVDTLYVQVAVCQPDTFGTEKVPVSNLHFELEDPAPLLRANGSNGLYSVQTTPNPASAIFILVLKSPTVVGDSLTYAGYVVRTGSLNESVTAPAGAFTCIRYDISLAGVIVGQVYAAPNIGIVKSRQRYFGLLRSVDQLRSYHLQ